MLNLYGEGKRTEKRKDELMAGKKMADIRIKPFRTFSISF